MSKEIAEEYASSLADLTVNSKPLINMLTILAEENIEHAGVIVETVEKHLEKVQPEIKLPVLYLVDSIIKNVGGAYTQKFSQSIVSMFTRTFKQVDEKTRSQMFKLRETWHDVFPATKLYQLDVKVNLIDPAWPIQAQPQQSNIHPVPTTSTTGATLTPEEEQMRSILAKKEQELLMLQKKKIEMELEQTKRQLENAEKNVIKPPQLPMIPPTPFPASMPIAMVNPVVTPMPPEVPVLPPSMVPVKQRLGPPVNNVNKTSRIAPVSGAMLAGARRDPRLARRPAPPPAAPIAPAVPIAPNVFDIKPLERVTKRNRAITIDVRSDVIRDPRIKRTQEERRRDRKPERQNRKKPEADKKPVEEPPKTEANNYIERLQIPDSKKISKLPPIPKINRQEDKNNDVAPSPTKKRKELREKKTKKRDAEKDNNVSTEKRNKNVEKPRKSKPKDQPMDVDAEKQEPLETFKELKNYHKERYMRRNKEKSESPENSQPVEQNDSANVQDAVVENKDVDLRMLHVPDAAPIVQKRPSTDALETKPKKSKIDKFDILFGNEDVDLRQLPQVEEPSCPPPPTIHDSPKLNSIENSPKAVMSPLSSPGQKDWHEVKEKEEAKKGPSKLDLVRAKLAEATKAKERRSSFGKSPSIERERKISNSDDNEIRSESEDDVNKETISMILTQAKEHYKDGKMDKNQYNTLMFQVMQLNEKLKLKEAKQRESLELSKRRLHNISDDEHANEHNKFGDIDERVTPAFIDTQPNNDSPAMQDSDMRLPPMPDPMNNKSFLPHPPMPPMFMGPFPPPWRGMRPMPLNDEFNGPRRPRGPMPPFFRNKFDMRPPRPPLGHPLNPKMGIHQGENPLKPYGRSESPPPLGSTTIPPTDYKVIEYIDQDPMKTIDIDGVPREIRFYGETAVIMLDWDDPREIKFLPGARRVTFDNKDSVVLTFNEPYQKVEIDDQVFNIRFGAPTRELYINGRWYECFFGAPPMALLIDGNPRMIQLEGPPPQVDIGKVRRTDLVAGKINLIVDAQHMCPVFLDSKVQKFQIDGEYYTIRFVDSLKTVLINEVPFKVEFGGLPKSISLGQTKHFIRFSTLPRQVKPGHIEIANMEGRIPEVKPVKNEAEIKPEETPSNAMETDEEISRPEKIYSPDGENSNQGGLDMLASVMPSSMAPASSFSGYSVAEPLFGATKSENIPGLDPQEEKAQTSTLPILANINVNDLFAKLVATGIVALPDNKKEESKESNEVKPKPKEDKTVVHHVDLLKSETLKVPQPALVARLYGGMQCSGCGARFPPERTVRYSQHLDWHFRQNRRERDSARRAHSRRWHYATRDWLRYEELDDAAEREKSWFETNAAEEASPDTLGAESAIEPAASVPAGPPAERRCALCGDRFLQFYNEDRDEWHLRNAVTHEGTNYHPACLHDYKASLEKAEELPQDMSEEQIIEDKTIDESVVEIKDVEDINSQSDDESVVEVIETTKDEISEPVEIVEADDDDLDDSDDVIYKAEPVEEVVVDDDADTDDETKEARKERDLTHQIDMAKIKVKQEPVDPDDEPVITAEEEAIRARPDTTSHTVQSSIDGNLQLEAAPAPVPIAAKIRINITKNITAPVAPQSDENAQTQEPEEDNEEPLPPGEEPEPTSVLKPAFEGVKLRRMPPVKRGEDLSGLCCVM